MWDYVKAHVYIDENASIDWLEENIEELIRGRNIEKIVQQVK